VVEVLPIGSQHDTPAPKPAPKPKPKPAPKPVPKPVVPAWPSWMPRGNYFGLITGPAISHGGIDAREKAVITLIQHQLVKLGYAGHVGAGWSDGIFGTPTYDAVSRFQHAHMPHTQFYGQVWSDDFAELFRL
jgi:hypothetical protein